ncbi:MAG: 3-hydroxyacyl-ACP dehydratase FabZ [Bilifractor sp.]|jgi:3-hydroxyacyl-[acyl-carrier-protein] dehydratase
MEMTLEKTNEREVISPQQMLKVLRHRYPFLLVDRIVDYECGKYVVGIKNVSFNEPWMPGHFPENPIYPGAFITESAAQTGAFLFFNPEKAERNNGGMLTGIEKFRFKQVVRPGDQLIIRVEAEDRFGRCVMARAKISVGGKRVAEGRFSYVLQ